MKKIPIFLLSILTASFGNLSFLTQNSLAMRQTDDTIWWSVDELLEFAEFADQEEQEQCGNDYDCRRELFYSKRGDDTRYEALRMFREGRFWATSINPQNESLEVIYFNENQFLKRWGRSEIQPLDFLFLAWFDNANDQIGNYDYNLPIEPQFSDDLHLMYANDATAYSATGFPENTPFNLPVFNTNLSENTLGYLYIATFGENHNSKGYLDYSSCLTDADYREGMTCELMFSSKLGYRYFPVTVIITEDQQPEPEPESEEPTPVTLTSEKTELPVIETTKTDSSSKTTASTIMKAPNTGSNTKTCDRIIEFPWWLAILIIIGNATILWFFLPNRQNHKKPKNFHKKS